MVTEAQHNALINECTAWHETLVQYCQKINDLKRELYFFAPGKTDKAQLLDIEHYHNQFHIQLINIHDLKHEIRFHLGEAKQHPGFGHRIPHHGIKEKYDLLLKDIDQLEADFHQFIKQ